MNQVPPLCKTPKTEVNTLCKPSNSTGANKSPFIKSFLFYVPYAVLGAMTFPAIFTATGHTLASCAGCFVGLVLAYQGKGLLSVAVASCITAYLAACIF